MEKLAIHGGEKAKKVPYGTGNRFGKEELDMLGKALEQNTLFYWLGDMTKSLCTKFADKYGMKYCVATSSGTASIHTALGAIGLEPGDEVITAPITDLGSVIGILYQNAVPVFADLDPHTYNMDPKAVEAKITDKTKAIVVVHLAGCAAPIDEIVEIAKKHNLYVIEDCAQSYGCTYKGKKVGTFGDIGCFSLNDFKHISAGDGGMLVTNNEDLYYKAHLFADKNYNRFGGAVDKDIASLAPNYRMNELTAAVGLVQLDKVDEICKKHNAYGKGITEGISGLKGIYTHQVLPDCYSSYWFYMIRLDEKELKATRQEFVDALVAEGVNAKAGYIPFCVYQYKMFKNRSIYGTSDCPFNYNNVEYKDGDCPVAEAILDTCMTIAVSPFFTEEDLQQTIAGFRKVWSYFQNR